MWISLKWNSYLYKIQKLLVFKYQVNFLKILKSIIYFLIISTQLIGYKLCIVSLLYSINW